MARAAELALAGLVLAACLACSAPGATASPSPPERAGLKIGVGGQGQLGYLPLTLAGELGYFRDEGLAVDIDDMRSGADALAALNGGSVDAVAGLYEDALRARAHGQAVEMVALYTTGPGLVLLVNKKHSDARSVKDLAALNIGVESLGSDGDEMVRYLFQVAGLDPHSVRTVAVGSGDPALAAFRDDTLQALVADGTEAASLLASGDGVALYDTRTAAGTRDVFGGSWPAAGLYLGSQFARENPRTVRALARATVRTLVYLHEHSAAEAAARLPGGVFYPGGSRDELAARLEAEQTLFSTDGKVPVEGPGDVLRTLKAADAGTDWSAVDLAKTYDNSFAAAAR